MKHHPTPLSSLPWRRAAATALLTLGTVTGALAQAFPDKPLKVIVGFPPGGAADQIARRCPRRLPPRWASR